jgi:hypothetical protein
MLQIRKNIPRKELHKIAKTIQWYYKAGLAKTYERAFYDIVSVTQYDSSKRYELRAAIEDCLIPSNKLHDPTKVKEILHSLSVFEDHDSFRYITFLARFKLPSLKIITSDLEVLMSDFGGIDFSNDELSVEMGPFELEGVYFGNFIATFSMRRFCTLRGESIPSVKAVEPNCPADDYDNEYSHPHVKGNEICLGQGRYPLASAVAEGRLQDCFEIIRSVLSTYNGNDPFAPIIRWTGSKCAVCGGYFDQDHDGSICNICNKTYCKDCVRQCCPASDFVCYRCSPPRFSCRYCGKALCSECVVICERCKHYLCSDHIDMGRHYCVY